MDKKRNIIVRRTVCSSFLCYNYIGGNMNNKIGVLDSGIGGLVTLDVIKKELPNEDFIYIADSKNNPYGEKSDEELFEIVNNNVKYLLSRNVKMVILACNTATTRCISKLRELYPKMLFVGIEPAIKIACDNDYNNTLVMATPGTISSDRTKLLIDNNKRVDQVINLVNCEGLANAIETNNELKIDELLKKELNPYINSNIDSVVLGCTHYPIIKDKIQNYFPNATIIDGNEGVAKRVKTLLTENNLLNNSNTLGNVEIVK